MEVKSKKIGSMQIATISHGGSYGEASRIYQEIMEWLRQKQLKIVGPPLGWFYDNPEEVPAHKLRSDVGIPFKGEAKAESNIKIKEIPAQQVLYTMHKGPYREVGPAYTALFQYAKEKGYVPLGCPMEIYLNDPSKVEESEFLTEVQQPIKKK
jgi:effector-binding domain-containing protein